jgi:hypothetical protein
MSDVLEAPKIAEAEDDDGNLHIVDAEKYPAEATVWRALCGESCFALDTDGGETCVLVPPDFDFYMLGHGHEKATCKKCRREAGLPV